MEMTRVLYRAVAIVASALITACAGVPNAQLSAYATAFDEVKSAGLAVYEESARKATVVQANYAFPLTLGAPILDRQGCGALIVAIGDYRARCELLSAIQSYNQALLDLAAGLATEDALKKIDGATSSLNALAGLIPTVNAAFGSLVAILGPAKAALEAALKAQDRQRLAQQLLVAAPLMQQAIDFLREDASRLYQLEYLYANSRLVKIEGQISQNLTSAFKEITTHSPPKDPNVAGELVLQQTRFEQIFSSPEPAFNQRLKDAAFSPSGASPFDAANVQRLGRQLQAASSALDGFRAEGLAFRRSAQAIGQFDLALLAWSKAHADLVSALNQPFIAGGGTEQAIVSLIRLRDQAKLTKQLLRQP
ncbi:hypothetical protein LP414_09420 [Polaromonas sp. P1(28)-13]|nr:hypothetical protein LP414_09420 [Polaromonas sp. P1(28)-13]